MEGDVGFNRSPHWARGSGTIQRGNLSEVNVTMDDCVYNEGFTRVDILGSNDFQPTHPYFQILQELGMTRTDVYGGGFEDVLSRFQELSQKKIDAGELLGLYALFTAPRFRDNSKNAHLVLFLARHGHVIDEIVGQLAARYEVVTTEPTPCNAE